MWFGIAYAYLCVVALYGTFCGFGQVSEDGWARKYTAGELAVMVIFWPVTLLMALQLVPGILDKMRGDDDEADE